MKRIFTCERFNNVKNHSFCLDNLRNAINIRQDLLELYMRMAHDCIRTLADTEKYKPLTTQLDNLLEQINELLPEQVAKTIPQLKAEMRYIEDCILNDRIYNLLHPKIFPDNDTAMSIDLSPVPTLLEKYKDYTNFSKDSSKEINIPNGSEKNKLTAMAQCLDGLRSYLATQQNILSHMRKQQFDILKPEEITQLRRLIDGVAWLLKHYQAVTSRKLSLHNKTEKNLL